MTAPRIEDTSTDHAADVEAIRRVIADIEKGFNTGDAELLVEHFTQNATAVAVSGAQLDGRDALLAFSRTALAGPLRGQRARYELADVQFVRPDVAVAHKHAQALDEAGEPADVGHAMSALYVLVREGGRWWVVARQKTLVSRP
ncbi:SgcJ/EcaC family oxidoreductase [Pseudonocardia nigra]|uniref:SgcJ/EcaC family oxidoreductase n=1 Tax=Pseudonocardia nigra TaxID=1921578 RepID=UPI001C601288|nr:SgcJ/EcaC family oxidoreductase [Pseudonocardia nigra]